MMNALNTQVIMATAPLLWEGLLYTVKLTTIATLGGVVLGTILAIARLGHSPLARVAAVYVNTMRAVPLLLVIFCVYLMLPLLLQKTLHLERPPRINASASAYLTFSVFEAAYFCEIVRAGIGSVSVGQRAAAAALGLTPAQAMRLILLPQAMRNVVPMLLTQVIVLFQDVSLVSLLNVTDLVGAAVMIAQRDGRIVEMYITVALIYLACCTTLSYAVERIQRRIVTH